MKYYIATGLENARAHNVLRDRLQAADHDITYDWTKHGSVWAEGLPAIRAVATYEARGVFAADVVIILLPGGRGTHVELGMAIGFGRAVVIVPDDPMKMQAHPSTCAFYHHPNVAYVPTESEVPAFIRAASFNPITGAWSLLRPKASA